MVKNYYEILDVACDVDPESLKKAYRRMAKKVHPDHQPDDAEAEERFKELLEAYEVLSDPERREQYDVLYFRQKAGAARNSGNGRQGTGSRAGMSGVVGDIFDLLKNRMESKGTRGEDHSYILSLTLEEAALGVKKDIHIPRNRVCSACSGRGWNTATQSHVCEMCRGEGEITLPIGGKREVRECPGCEGTGLNEKISCRRCKGSGSITLREKVPVDIPAGVDNGSRLKIREEGGDGENGGGKGDLYIIIQVKDHRRFKRNNLDIWTDLTLHFTQAALGAKIKVPTLAGEHLLTVPPGTQSGEVFVLEGLGIPGLHGSYRGDQKVRVKVRVPRKMTPEERKILNRWKEMQNSG